MSSSHLRRLSLSLIQVFELDTTDIKIIEERTSWIGHSKSARNVVIPLCRFLFLLENRNTNIVKTDFTVNTRVFFPCIYFALLKLQMNVSNYEFVIHMLKKTEGIYLVLNPSTDNQNHSDFYLKTVFYFLHCMVMSKRVFTIFLTFQFFLFM